MSRPIIRISAEEIYLSAPSSEAQLSTSPRVTMVRIPYSLGLEVSVKFGKAISTIVPALVLVGCVSGPAPTTDYGMEDCDRHDLVEFDSDCGYWDASGAFVLWWWVTPGLGGVRPYAWEPRVPPGGTTRRPKNARPSATKVQPAPTVSMKQTPTSRPSAPTKPRKTN